MYLALKGSAGGTDDIGISLNSIMLHLCNPDEYCNLYSMAGGRAVKTFSKELEGGKEGRVFRKCFYKVHLGMI